MFSPIHASSANRPKKMIIKYEYALKALAFDVQYLSIRPANIHAFKITNKKNDLKNIAIDLAVKKKMKAS